VKGVEIQVKPTRPGEHQGEVDRVNLNDPQAPTVADIFHRREDGEP
tara:strand:+ start:3476 stop:3613 length:138 start_codon:yes stop_codon:yes gene_type:complete